MTWRQKAGCVLTVVGLGWGAGCKNEPEPPAPAVEDAEGDWMDTGRYAACTVNRAAATCGEASSFELSGCEPASLARLPADGIYTLVYRREGTTTPLIDAGSFRISADGTLDSFRGGKPTVRDVSADRFYLSSSRTTSASVSLRNAVAGCRAEGERLYGCYVNCRNNQPTAWGTFVAERWKRRAGEAEALGLRLLSETRVGLGLPVDIYVTQGHAYVVSVNWNQPGGLSVFDVRDPAAPVLKKTISLPTDNYWNGVWSKGNALYVASADRGVVVFDLANPADPVLVRAVPSGRGAVDVHTVFVEGERLYAMSPYPTPQTFIFDLREPTAPVLLGEYAEPGAELSTSPGYPHDALAFEGRLYINHWSAGYLIVDVNDPASPRKLGAFKYPYATSHANAVGRFGDRLIAFEGGESWGAHLRVLDVTDPAAPRRIGEYKLGDHVSPHNMVLVGQRLYIAHYQQGVRVLDVSVPESPRELAYYNTYRESDPGRGESFYDGAIGIRVPGDGHVYVIDTSRGLLVFPEP